jgi:hypothetical protein
MIKILKNVACGIGNVFIDVSSPTPCLKNHRGGFREDAAQLRGDAQNVLRGMSRNIKRAKNGKIR